MWEKVRRYIEGYLNQTHIESLTIFQKLLQQTKNYEFIPEKLSTCRSQNKLLKKTVTSLHDGFNKTSSISIVILRSIHSNNFTFLLATENIPQVDISKYVFIVVVWPKEQEMISRWKEQLSLNMWVTVRQPYKMRRNDNANYLLVRLENLVIEQGKRWKEKPQSVKEKANNLYKHKQYMDAFIMYEFALCNSHQHQKSLERAILYGNSAACLYELRLFSSALLYCNLAITSEPKYPKGYIRKVNCLLQLSQYSLISPCMLKLKGILNQKQFQPYNEKVTLYLRNDIGIYDWLGMLNNNKKDNERLGSFGEYHNIKVQLIKDNDQNYFIAREDIAQYQLLVVNKPLIYLRLHNKNQSSENFRVILDQIKKNCFLQKSFYESMKLCPPMSAPNNQKKTSTQSDFQFDNSQSQQLFRHPLDKKYTPIQEIPLEKDIIKKLEYSLFLQRELEEVDDFIGYGLWKDAFFFPLDCAGNCTYFHLRNSFIVFAAREIKKGEKLTIDYLADVEAFKRQEIMKLKYKKNCLCTYCSLNKWPDTYDGDIEGLYKLIDQLPDNKTKKQIIFQIITKKAENQDQDELVDSLFPRIIYRYMMFIQREPQWEDIVNLTRLLRDQKDEQLNSHLNCLLMKCFLLYLKMPAKDLQILLQHIK